MNKILNFLKEHIFIVYVFVILVFCIIIYFNNDYTFFWYDEGFSLSLIKHSYAEIWSLTAEDVHPPFYYFLLKIYTSVFGSSIPSARFFSAIPVLFTVIVACTFIRKQWGNKAGLFFLLLLLLTPVTKYLTSEIRMYSWAMFLVLMTFIFAYLSFTREKKYYFIPLLLFSIMAAYTHYYALISVFFIYAVFLFLLLFYKRDKLLVFIAVSIAFILSYIPWLVNLLKQVRSVTKDYWIDMDALKKDLFESLYPISKVGVLIDNDEISFYLKMVVLVGFFAYAFYMACSSAKDKKLFYTAAIALFVFVLPAVAGVIFSVAIKPVFVPRYICCFIGLYLLGAALLFSNMDFSKRAPRITLSLFFLLSIYFNISLYKHKFKENRADSRAFAEMVSFIEEDIDDKTAFLYIDSVYPQLAIYPIIFPENEHICKITGVNMDITVMDIFNFTAVSSFDNIDTVYNKLYIADHYPQGGLNLIKLERDSIEITRQFEVVDKIERARNSYYAPSIIYRLKRRVVN